MKKGIYILIALIAISCSNQNVDPRFFVSPSGNDSNVGSLEAPFATIEKAKQAVRELSKKQRSKNITVFLREGTHTLSETVVFGLEDSGADGTKIIKPKKVFNNKQAEEKKEVKKNVKSNFVGAPTRYIKDGGIVPDPKPVSVLKNAFSFMGVKTDAV